MPSKLLWKKPHLAWLLWQTSKMLALMNELTVTSNIGTMSAWSYMTRSEDEWLSAALSNQLPQATWEVSSLLWPWFGSVLQCCTQGAEQCVPSVSTAQTALQTKASVWQCNTRAGGPQTNGEGLAMDTWKASASSPDPTLCGYTVKSSTTTLKDYIS